MTPSSYWEGPLCWCAIWRFSPNFNSSKTPSAAGSLALSCLVIVCIVFTSHTWKWSSTLHPGCVPPTLTAPVHCCCCFRDTRAETNVSVLPTLWACVFHEVPGCGSLSSPAAAVTRYSAHTFLWAIQARLRATILVYFNLSKNTAALKRRAYDQQLMNSVRLCFRASCLLQTLTWFWIFMAKFFFSLSFSVEQSLRYLSENQLISATPLQKLQ